MRHLVWIVSDHERVNTGDTDDPRVVALLSTAQLAHQFAAALNGRDHPSSAVGYAYDFRVSEERVLDGEWANDEIVEALG